MIPIRTLIARVKTVGIEPEDPRYVRFDHADQGFDRCVAELSSSLFAIDYPLN